MKSKITFKWSLFILGQAGLALVLISILFLSFNKIAQGSYTASQALTLPISSQDPKKTGPDLPLSLNIPKIKVSTAIKYVGLTRGGAMDVPKNPADVAWFNLGPRPGEIGSAVISGHYGWGSGIAAAFDNLNKLKKGDKIYAKDKKGTTIIFVVRELQIYKEFDNATKVFNSSDGKAHLNLITCSGTWNKISKTYSNRLIVFADME